MNMRIFAAAALVAGMAVAGHAVAGPRPANYDGTWSVRLVTEAGTCDPHYDAVVRIADGRVSPMGTGGAASVSGGVGGDGRVALDIRRSLARADAYGRLQARSGAGVWKVDMLGCTGRWTAQRQSRQAAAD